MASLGNIWFDLGLVDKTGKDLEKILKKLKENDFKLEVGLDDDKIKETLNEAVKGTVDVNKNFESLSKSMGISVEQAKKLVDAMEVQDSSQIAILMNTEKVTRAKERLLELERSIHLKQLDQTDAGKKTLAWIDEAKGKLEDVTITDKMEVVKATGADLAAQINVRKDLMRQAAQEVANEAKASKDLVFTNDRVEKALLRIEKIRGKIKNDSSKDQEGYREINKELDKMAATIESVRDKSKSDSKDVLGIDFDRSLQSVESMIKNQDLLYMNAEKVTRAKERLLELERSIHLRQLEQTDSGKEILAWIDEAKGKLESVTVTDKMEVAKATGAELAAQINERKNLMRQVTQEVSNEAKAGKEVIFTNDKVERALLRIEKIRDRIKNDPFRDQEGYKGVNKELDKMAKTIESVRNKSKSDAKNVLGIGFDKSVQSVESMIKKQDLLYRNTNKQVTHMGRMWGQLGNQVKNVISIYAMQRFTKSLIEMGGEFEKQKFALRAIVGDLGRADQIYNNLKKVAVKSPFHFGDFTGYAKQLAAFSIPVNEIYETTKRLADVSAGLGVDMGRIILAYGQIRAASYLTGQEVRQLTEAGIPIIEELAVKLTELKGITVSTGEVFEAISRREVPFAMIKEVFKDLTDEGGKFYRMQEVLAESLSGKWSNLTSHYQIMLDEMAQGSRGALNWIIEALTWFVKNADRAMSILSGIFIGTMVGVVGKGVEKLVKNLGEASLSWGNLGKAFTKTIGPANLAGAAVGIISSALFYVKQRADKFEESITEIISVSYNLVNSVKRSTSALIELTKAQGDDVNVAAERQKIIKKLAQTEPALAEEIKNHADNMEWLTKKTEEYIAAKEAARDLDIASKGTGAFTKSLESLEKNLSKAEGDLRKNMIELRRNYAVFLKNLGPDIEKTLSKSYDSGRVSEIIKIIGNDAIDDAEKMAKIYYIQAIDYAERYIKEGAKKYESLADEYVLNKKKVKTSTEKLNKEIKILSDVLVASLKQNTIYAAKGTSEEVKKQFQIAAIEAANISKEAKEMIAEVLGLEIKGGDDGKDKLTGWQKDINEILGNIVTITPASTIKEVMDDVSSEIDKSKKFLDSIDISSHRGKQTETSKAVTRQYEAEEEALEKLTKAFKLLGLVSKSTGGGSKKDPLAEQMKDRVDLIKEAISYYNKYIPILGRVRALEKVQSEERFKGLSFDPDGVRDSLLEVYSKLGDTDAQKKVKESITSMITDIDFEKVKEATDKLAKDTSRYIEDNKERWDIFDKLFEQSGDMELSFKLAFGTEGDESIKSFIDSLESKLSELTEDSGLSIDEMIGLSPDDLESKFSKPVIDLINKIRDERVKARQEILLSDAKAIAETAGMEEKAAAITAKYKEKIAATDNEEAIAAHTKQMNDELSDLYSKAIQLSPVWAELFGDVSDYSHKMLINLVNRAKELANTAKEIKDADGKGTGMFVLVDEEDSKFKIKGEELTRMLKSIAKKSDEIRKNNPFGYFADAWKRFVNAPNGEEKDKAMKQLFESSAMVASEVSEIASSFADMFDALGNEELADTVGLIGDIGAELGGIAEGYSKGGALGATLATLKAVPSIIGSIARHHDKKLDRKIQKSAQEVKRLQNAYENVNKEVERQLGAMTKGQIDKQIGSLKGQIEETQSMMEKERKKKKSDQGKIDDYKQQIKELNDQVQYFYEDLAKNLYDIDIKGWAGQFSSAIMDAWRKGGDAAKAYEETANEVLANVANKMLAETILEPAFKQLREKLPGMLDKGSLSKEDMGDIAKTLVDVGDQWGNAINMLEEVNEVIKEQSGGRFDLKLPDELESNLGKGIQATTEDTSQLLASYLNAIRQDVSVNRDILTNLADAITGSISSNIAMAVADLKKIEANTFRSANGVDSINDKLDAVMNGSRRIYTE